MKVSIEGQGHFMTLFFAGFCAYTRSRYHVSVYRTIGPLVYLTPSNLRFTISTGLRGSFTQGYIFMMQISYVSFEVQENENSLT